MTTDQRDKLEILLANKDALNKKREHMLNVCLAEIAPALAKIKGGGFEYSYKLKLAELIKGLTYPLQPTGNHVERNWDQFLAIQFTYPLILEELQEHVKKNLP